jgi:peptide deformylase
MSILKVARMGHPVLRRRARPLSAEEVASAPIQKLIDDMLETMHEYNGIGLAAPQIHESVRLFVAGIEDAEEGSEGGVTAMPFINREISRIGRDIVEDWEGCLSIPDLRGRVPRSRRIHLRAMNREGRRIEIQADGYYARVLQHETDHLDGILFLDRMTSFDTLTYLNEFGKYWDGD